MISPTADTIRLTLHILAATVWVGGQIVLGGLVPTIRKIAPESVGMVAKAFSRVAWPAFGLLVITGMWNILHIKMTEQPDGYQVTVMAHVLLAVLTGVFAAIHSLGKSKLALAIGGALGLACSLGALFLGVLLTSGTVTP